MSPRLWTWPVSKAGIDTVKVRHRPRLLSDNGPCYISKELKEYLDDTADGCIPGEETLSSPDAGQDRGAIIRSIKNVINLQNYYLPGELEREIERFVEYYNNKRYHESLDNLTPADVYSGRRRECLSIRDMIKRKTLRARKAINLGKGVQKNQLLLTKYVS